MAKKSKKNIDNLSAENLGKAFDDAAEKARLGAEESAANNVLNQGNFQGGGPAIRLRQNQTASNNPSNPNNPDINDDSGDGDDKMSITAQGAAEFAKKASSKAVKAAAKEVAAIWARLVAGGPVVWIIVALSITLIILMFILGLSYIGSFSGTGPSETGGTRTQQIDSIKDKDIIKTALKLSGAKAAIKESTEAASNKIAGGFQKFKDDVASKNPANAAALTTQADATATALSLLQSNPTQESAQKFLAEARTFYDLIEDTVPPYPVDAGHPTRFPVTNQTNTFIFNNDLHGFSFLHGDAVPNHNVYIRDSNNKERCDAVDVSTTTGDAVYPIFGGTVTDVSTDGDGGDGQKIMVQDGDYIALYAHLKNISKKKGEPITIQETLGAAKGNNIQIEIVYKDTCLVTTHGDMIDHASQNGAHDAWGGYLWDRIVNRFSLGGNLKAAEAAEKINAALNQAL